MHHYPHHLGDYAKDTPGLTMIEHGAYRLLMDAYYATEAPLAADEIYAIARAANVAERRAVDKILRKFFIRRGEFFHQKRIDEEIAIYQEKVEKNRVNGRLGGRPHKTQTVSQSVSQTVSETKPKQNPEITLTNSHEPITKEKLGAVALTILVSDGLTEQTAVDFLQIRKRKRAPLTPTAWAGIKAEAAKAGWSVEDAVKKAIARGWQSFDADWVASEKPKARALPDYK